MLAYEATSMPAHPHNIPVSGPLISGLLIRISMIYAGVGRTDGDKIVFVLRGNDSVLYAHSYSEGHLRHIGFECFLIFETYEQ